MLVAAFRPREFLLGYRLALGGCEHSITPVAFIANRRNVSLLSLTRSPLTNGCIRATAVFLWGRRCYFQLQRAVRRSPPPVHKNGTAQTPAGRFQVHFTHDLRARRLSFSGRRLLSALNYKSATPCYPMQNCTPEDSTVSGDTGWASLEGTIAGVLLMRRRWPEHLGGYAAIFLSMPRCFSMWEARTSS
jgi:hypothetical protein